MVSFVIYTPDPAPAPSSPPEKIPGPPLIVRRDSHGRIVTSDFNMPDFSAERYEIPGPMVFENELSDQEKVRLAIEVVKKEREMGLPTSFVLIHDLTNKTTQVAKNERETEPHRSSVLIHDSINKNTQFD